MFEKAPFFPNLPMPSLEELVKIYIKKFRKPPAKHFTLLEPQNLWIDVFELNEICRSANFEAVKLKCSVVCRIALRFHYALGPCGLKIKTN